MARSRLVGILLLCSGSCLMFLLSRDLTDLTLDYHHNTKDISTSTDPPKVTFRSRSRKGPNASEEFQVPNIVHYLHYSNKSDVFQFKHWISVLSAHKILHPDQICIHYNRVPEGEYWNYIKDIPSVRLVREDAPTTLLGEKLKPYEGFTTASNIARVKVLLETGGIYLDFDVLVVRSFDDLRRYPCTVGYEMINMVCGGIIICSKTSPFLYLWANAYLDDFRPDTWAYNTGHKPTSLARRFPSLVHTEYTRLQRPNWSPGDIGKIWGKDTWDWRSNYAVHTWYRLGQEVRQTQLPGSAEPDKDNVWTMNNTYAEIARYILRLP